MRDQVSGVTLRQLKGQSTNVGVGGLNGHAFLHTSDTREAVAPRREIFRIDDHGQPDLDVRIVRMVEAGLGYADDTAAFTVDRDGLTEDVLGTAIPPLPQAMTENRHELTIRQQFLLREAPAQQGRSAQHVEERPRDASSG